MSPNEKIQRALQLLREAYAEQYEAANMGSCATYCPNEPLYYAIRKLKSALTGGEVRTLETFK
jgi:hypothetical protein